LPLIDNAHVSELPPFSIQVAGLSQIEAAASEAFAGLSKAEAAQAQEELLAELDAAFPSMVEAIKGSGAGYVRLYISWSSIQREKGSAYQWTFYDKRLPQFSDAGLGIIATISGVPEWAKVGGNPCNILSADGVQAYYTFLEAIAARYPLIDVWEIFNEPDAINDYRCGSGVENYGNNGMEYAELLQGAYTRLKALNPSGKIIMGGMAYDSFVDQEVHHFNRYFLDAVVQSGGANFMDGVNFHYFKNFASAWEGWTGTGKPTCLGEIDREDGPNDKFYYPYGYDITAKASHLSERLSTCFGVNKPLWATEIGANGVGTKNPDYPYTQDSSNQNPKPHLFGATTEDQAQYVFKVHARGFASGVENLTWYAIQIVSSILEEDHQGLLYDERDGVQMNGQPKPAYFAYQTMTRELGYYRYDTWVAFDPHSKPAAEAYQFRHFAGNNAGSPKIVAWSNSGTQTLTLPASTVRVVSRPGNGTIPEESIVTDGGSADIDGAGNGTITLALTVEPVIIELSPR
jgi:hypothetical protein